LVGLNINPYTIFATLKELFTGLFMRLSSHESLLLYRRGHPFILQVMGLDPL
jgi:hypothetical protein